MINIGVRIYNRHVFSDYYSVALIRSKLFCVEESPARGDMLIEQRRWVARELRRSGM
jgi:hypothetical protein